MDFEFEFGRIVIDGKEYKEDVIIYPDRVERRKKELSKNKKEKYSHTPLTKEELEEEVKERYDYILIGTGTNGYLPIEYEAVEYLKLKARYIIIGKTKDILKIYNEISKEGKTLAIIHITC